MQLPIWMLLALLFWVPVVQAATIRPATPSSAQATLQQIHQRHWFQQARRALNRHDMKKFHSLRAKLASYPLTPYLDIWHARKTLKRGNDRLVADTLAQYADIPETINLRRAWVRSLAKRGRWSHAGSIMVRFPKLKLRLPDIAILALWHTGQQSEAMRLYSARWQQGKKVPFNMVGLHQSWFKQGHPTTAERWTRIEHAARLGNWKQVRYLAKSLSKKQKQWLKYWRGIQKHPGKTLQRWPSAFITRVPAAMIMRDGIRHLSRYDPGAAWRFLQQQSVAGNKAGYLLELERDTALRAARRHIPEAAEWLATLPDSLQNENTRSWRARIQILQQNWKKTLQAIASMPEAEQQQSRWIYWSARAAEAIGEPEAARFLFAKLAVGRGYYSFLSAEHIGQPFRFSSSGLIGSDHNAEADQTITAIEQMPAVRRAYEWLQLGKRSKAAREWHHALAGLHPQQWQAAAVIAARWHWHDQVIRAAFKANKLDAMPDRFPLAFEKEVIAAARQTGLKPASIWSIIRQESAFNQQAVSYVGAKGLMQLMPRTARKMAHKLGMDRSSLHLFSPAVNIRLGSAYLVKQKRRFGNLALAAAAYNAGPHRVSRWLKRTPFDAPEAWVEAIPFNETRRYVQQVMAFVSVYEWRQHKDPTSLIGRLNGQVQTVSLVKVHAMIVP